MTRNKIKIFKATTAHFVEKEANDWLEKESPDVESVTQSESRAGITLTFFYRVPV